MMKYAVILILLCHLLFGPQGFLAVAAEMSRGAGHSFAPLSSIFRVAVSFKELV